VSRGLARRAAVGTRADRGGCLAGCAGCAAEHATEGGCNWDPRGAGRACCALHTASCCVCALGASARRELGASVGAAPSPLRYAGVPLCRFFSLRAQPLVSSTAKKDSRPPVSSHPKELFRHTSLSHHSRPIRAIPSPSTQPHIGTSQHAGAALVFFCPTSPPILPTAPETLLPGLLKNYPNPQTAGRHRERKLQSRLEHSRTLLSCQ
jgi:hypothetical protein